ncbi:MAG: DUF4089 domain-containing protein [Geminicoccaceae bacterium]
MADTDGFDADGWIAAVAPVLGLSVTDDQRPGVRTFLTLAKAMADKLDAVQLDDAAFEPAPVFTPEADDA